MKKQPYTRKVLAGFIMVLASFSSFILCIFRLIHKAQVERSKEKTFIQISPLASILISILLSECC